VLLFYLRVFVNKGLRLATMVAIGVVAAWTIGNVISLCLACQPFDTEIDFTVLEQCPDTTRVFVSVGAYNIISDIVILVLPIPTIWALKTGWHFKVAITGILALGLL
jgi:hypothetical protein